VWRERRRERIRQLEDAVAEAQASQAELMRRLELFEKIAATAGVELGERQQPADVPEPLVAAARDPRQDAPVRLEVAGREFIRRRWRRGRRSAGMVDRDPASGFAA
jgi:hypothetical protein